MSAEKTNLLDLNREQLEAFFIQLGEKRFRATQVLKWIYQFGVDDFQHMNNLSKALRTRLSEVACIQAPRIVEQQQSEDGTRKWVLQMHCGNCVESVFIPEAERGTLCVSSQVGCSLNCRFCSTAQQGFNRNLSCAEIIGQLYVANRALGFSPKGERIISNVVMMGMGEPLLNFDAMSCALDLMMDDFAYGLSKRRVTVSTAGLVPAIAQLKQRCDVSLAVSLHAPNDGLRSELVPLNKKYPLRQLLDACKAYVENEPRRKVTFEYVMLQEINDTPQHALELVRLLKGVPAKVNLIPFNPFPNTQYRCSSRERIQTFYEILMQHGLLTTTRKTRGEDIDAACGQLVGKVMDRTKRQMRYSGVSLEVR